MPKRIQRQRTKGWRMPEGVVYVGRPSDWGNPYVVGDCLVHRGVFDDGGIIFGEIEVTDETCLSLFEMYARQQSERYPAWLEPLRGKELACWCPLSSSCHADILLKLANP